jgi:hypothetical protein
MGLALASDVTKEYRLDGSGPGIKEFKRNYLFAFRRFGA